jgi:hypothetical protein
MDNQRRSSGKQISGIAALLLAVAVSWGPQVHAQQQQQTPKLTAAYAKAALASLHAIESDISAPQDKNSHISEVSATQRKIDAADQEAATEQEASLSKMLHQIYRLRLRDNDLLGAYQKLIEVESSPDESDEIATKKRKDSSADQLADNQEAIEKREENCFWELEDSLQQRSPRIVAACSAWIRKAKLSVAGPAKPAASDESNLLQRADIRETFGSE